MRKLILLLGMILLANPSYSDGFDDMLDVERAWDGQKTITNQEYEEVIDALEEKVNNKEEKKQKKRFKKIIGGGTSLHKELNPDNNLVEIEIPNPEEGVLINIPVNLALKDCVLQKGYYKVLPEKDKKNNKFYIKFYQSQYLMGILEVVETEDDFGQKDLNFAEILPINEGFVKLIYGSIEFNAYSIVNIVE